MRRGVPAVALVMLACVAIIAGCGTSGRELRESAPGATAPPRRADSTTTTFGGQVTVDPDAAVLRPTGFSLTAVGWTDEGAMPIDLGCGGADLPPSLAISGVPAGTAELLLVATDTAAPSFHRWILATLPATTVAITRGSLPAGAVELLNSTGSRSWTGPCPAPGTTTRFQLRLYALATPSGLTASSGTDAIPAVISTATHVAALRGDYTR